MTVAADVTSPFHVKVYSLDTAPGDIVSIDGTHAWNARGVQGFLAQDKANPVYDLSTLEVVYDEDKENTMHLVPDNYSYIFFDKYTENKPASGSDTRNLSVVITGSSTGEIVNQSYTQPAPTGVEGVVAGNYTVSAPDDYIMNVDTEDSIYWMYTTCESAPVCGDGIKDESEECDDGANNGLVCEAPYGEECTYCTEACEEAEATGPYCGDEIKNGDEQCDFEDGVGDNQVCADDCTLVSLSDCGDGIKDDGEECDDGEGNGLVCEAGYGQTCSYCSSICTDIEIAGPNCGDGVKQDNEQCDDGNIDNGDGCSATCTIESTPPNDPVCGNGIKEVGEECDDNGNNGLVCEAGYGQTCSYCSSICTDIEIAGPNCGDGVKQDNEQCDDGNIDNGDGCSATCTIESTPPNDPVCGNGIQETGEKCDDGNNQDNDGCTAECTIESSGGGGGRFYKYTNQGQVEPVIEEEPIVLAEEGAPVLTITKTNNIEFANPGDTNIQYSVVVANTGDLTAYMVSLTDVLPNGLAYTDNVLKTQTWTLGDIAEGESVETKYLVSVDEAAKSGIYVNTAEAIAVNHPAVNDTAQLEVREIVVLAETGFSLPEFISLFLSAVFLLAAAKGLKQELASV